MTVGAPISSVEVAGMGVSIRTVTVRRVPSLTEPDGEMLSSVTTGQGGSPSPETQRFSWASASPVRVNSASVEKKANASNEIAITAATRWARCCKFRDYFGGGGRRHNSYCDLNINIRGLYKNMLACCLWHADVGEEDWPCLAVYRAPGRVGQTGPNAALSWEKPRKLSHFDSF